MNPCTAFIRMNVVAKDGEIVERGRCCAEGRGWDGVRSFLFYLLLIYFIYTYVGTL